MNAKHLFLTGLGLGVLGALAFFSSRSRPVPDGRMPSLSQAGAAAGRSGESYDVAPAKGGGAGFAGVREQGSRTLIAEEVPHADSNEVDAVSTLPSTHIAVTGTVRFSGDGAPASGVSFVLRHAGGRVIVHASDDGRFTTEAVVDPGVVHLTHKKTAGTGRYPQRLLFESESLTVPAELGGLANLDLVLLRPEFELLVRVVDIGGAVVSDASVEFESRHEPHVGEFFHRQETSTTGADGRTSFGLYDRTHLRAVRLVARRARVLPDGRTEELVSEHQQLELAPEGHPFTEPVRLVLDSAGSLLVRIVQQDPLAAPISMALPGQAIWVGERGPFLTSWGGPHLVSDEHGEMLITGLPPQDYAVGLVGHNGVPPRDVTVRAAETTEVEFTLPIESTELAAAGRVVDENDEPLVGTQIDIFYGSREGSGGTRATTTTDADGRFEFRAAPCLSLTVATNRDLFGDEYEPECLTVPFASTDLLFRRARAVSCSTVEFEVVDDVTQERLPGVLVMTYRAPHLDDYAFHRAKDGLASPVCAEHADTTLVIALGGYRRATFALADLLAQKPGQGLRRVGLERGLLRTLHVIGDTPEGDRVPVQGARLLDGLVELGRTDDAGSLSIDLYAAPRGALTLSAGGYAPAYWVPADNLAEVGPALLRLERE